MVSCCLLLVSHFYDKTNSHWHKSLFSVHCMGMFQERCVSGIIFYLVLVRHSVFIWLIMLSADETDISSRCSLCSVHYMVFMICIKTSVNLLQGP